MYSDCWEEEGTLRLRASALIPQPDAGAMLLPEWLVLAPPTISQLIGPGLDQSYSFSLTFGNECAGSW